MSMTTTTEIHNQTPFRLKVQVGNAQYKSDLTTVEAGGKYVIGVDVNGTYREYHLTGNSTKDLVVSSDDLCDNKSITIRDEAGKLQVHKESRQQGCSNDNTESSTSSATVANKVSSWISSWVPKPTSRNT